MNLTINKLPTRTWNHLGMNERVLSLEEPFTPHQPEALWTDPELTVEQKAPALPFPVAAGDLTPLMQGDEVLTAEMQTGSAVTDPLVLRYIYQKGERGRSRLILHAKKESRMDVILLLSSEAAAAAALQVEVYAEEKAEIRLYLSQMLEQSSLSLTHISATLEDSAALKLIRLELGSKRAYSGVQVDLSGKDSSFDTKLAYHVLPGQTLDMNYDALHHGKNTRSDMEVSGTLEEGAKKLFRGTIDFQKGCAGAKGDENEHVLLLGEEMVNQTIPLILCKEEDVEGNHGASIGQLDEKVLFYLANRGFDAEEAKQLMAASRLEAVCSLFPQEQIREQISAFEASRRPLGGEL